MNRAKKKKQDKGMVTRHGAEDRRKSPRASRILLGLAGAAAVAGICLILLRQGPESEHTRPAENSLPRPGAAGHADLQALVGKWIRPDGGYTLSVRHVEPDGRVEAAYFNPRPIQVSRAEASAGRDRIKLFIELQAPGYPGSTYELFYDPGNDVLAGVYFQAAMGQQFDVFFVRAE